MHAGIYAMYSATYTVDACSCDIVTGSLCSNSAVFKQCMSLLAFTKISGEICSR